MQRKRYKVDETPRRTQVTTLVSRDWQVVHVGETRLDFGRWRRFDGATTLAGRDKLIATMASALQRLTSS